MSSPASAARTASDWWPVTTSTGRARLASAVSAAMRTIGLPLTSASNLFSAPIRVERPAASTMQATLGTGAMSLGSIGCSQRVEQVGRIGDSRLAEIGDADADQAIGGAARLPLDQRSGVLQQHARP